MNSAKQAYTDAYRAIRLLSKMEGGDQQLTIFLLLLPVAQRHCIEAAKRSFDLSEVEDSLWEAHFALKRRQDPRFKAFHVNIEALNRSLFEAFKPLLSIDIKPIVFTANISQR